MPFTVPTTVTSLPLIFGFPFPLSSHSRPMSDSSTTIVSGSVRASRSSRDSTSAAPAAPSSRTLPKRKHSSVPPPGFVKLAKLAMYSSTDVTPDIPSSRVRYDDGMGFPRSTLGTPVEPIHTSADVWSMGMDVILNRPRSSPHCSAMRTAENVTASTPEAYRERSCQSVCRA